MAMLTINDVQMPRPTKYKVDVMDLDSENTIRTESGIITRDRIRAGVYKIDVAFEVCKSQLKAIADSIAPESFPVTFFDPFSLTDSTKTMYAGNKSCDLKSYLNEAAPNDSVWELSFSMVEV